MSVLLPPGSVGMVEAQPPPGLLTAPLHNSVDDAVDERRCSVHEARLQMLEQGFAVQPQEAQGYQDEVFG